MNLIEKYNVPGPRYTSYPTVPYWDHNPTEADWKALVKDSFDAYNATEGVSIYIHLPFCESLCTFCGCTTRITVNHAVETPYIDAVLAEWELYVALFEDRPRIKEIHLGGGTPTFFSPENLKRLISGITSAADLCDDAQLGFEANPRTTSYEHLKMLASLGFTRLSLGIQDFDPVVQKAIHRIQGFTQVKMVTDWARELGYSSINFDLVYGLPFQTASGIENTIDMVNLLRPDRIAFYSYAHVPWVKPGQRSFTEMDLPDSHQKFDMYARGKALLLANGYVEIGMDHFALPEEELTLAFRNGTMHRNFMGYTTQPSKLLIGLGVSAISDTWTGFAQNLKVVEAYTEAVNEGRFPIFRGHILTEEDIRVRTVILDIMCHFKADLSLLPLQLRHEALDMLMEMQRDDLIAIRSDVLRVTPSGRPFVRNICMAFDARLKRKEPATQLFSMTV